MCCVQMRGYAREVMGPAPTQDVSTKEWLHWCSYTLRKVMGTKSRVMTASDVKTECVLGSPDKWLSTMDIEPFADAFGMNVMLWIEGGIKPTLTKPEPSRRRGKLGPSTTIHLHFDGVNHFKAMFLRPDDVMSEHGGLLASSWSKKEASCQVNDAVDLVSDDDEDDDEGESDVECDSAEWVPDCEMKDQDAVPSQDTIETRHDAATAMSMRAAGAMKAATCEHERDRARNMAENAAHLSEILNMGSKDVRVPKRSGVKDSKTSANSSAGKSGCGPDDPELEPNYGEGMAEHVVTPVKERRKKQHRTQFNVSKFNNSGNPNGGTRETEEWRALRLDMNLIKEELKTLRCSPGCKRNCTKHLTTDMVAEARKPLYSNSEEVKRICRLFAIKSNHNPNPNA